MCYVLICTGGNDQVWEVLGGGGGGGKCEYDGRNAGVIRRGSEFGRGPFAYFLAPNAFKRV